MIDRSRRRREYDPVRRLLSFAAPSSLLAGILAFAPGTALAAAWVVEGRVVGVPDGDTITVLDDSKSQHKIRFAGIDAPEEGQAFAGGARENLSRLVFDKTVEVHCNTRDRDGREVYKVMHGVTV